ncbi:hypothetical protein KKA15_00200 [Patescibacteria group bacterium]|nr:hypothetical protein [Patescibacteria group bacterium]
MRIRTVEYRARGILEQDGNKEKVDVIVALSSQRGTIWVQFVKIDKKTPLDQAVYPTGKIDFQKGMHGGVLTIEVEAHVLTIKDDQVSKPIVPVAIMYADLSRNHKVFLPLWFAYFLIWLKQKRQQKKERTIFLSSNLHM